MQSSNFSPVIAERAITEINSLFQILFKYWDVCSKRYTEYTSLQVEFITADFYQILSNYWDRNNWDIDELKVICAVLDVNY